MNAEIITIGDELLIGQVIDTNSAWIAGKLNEIGIFVSRRTAVGDSRQQILNALSEASSREKIIIVTGGLGPTRDDITKKTFCEYFNCGTRPDDKTLENIERIFSLRNYKLTDINRGQAEVPENCIALQNDLGTAPGMWFEENGIIYISLPGVPHEMKFIMENSVLEKLSSSFTLPSIYHKTVITQGIGESALAEMISSWEDTLVEKNIKLAYLPAPGIVRLRLTASGPEKKEVEERVEQSYSSLKPLIAKFLFAEADENSGQLIGKLLRKYSKKLATAESCTGGYIAHLITSVPGSSEYYEGSVVSYSYQVKESLLDVSRKTLDSLGAVSGEVVEQMAEGAFKKFDVDYVISASGIAGPGGGTEDKPVGTVWICVASKDKKLTRRFMFGDNRERNIHKTAMSGLMMLKQLIEEENS